MKAEEIYKNQITKNRWKVIKIDEEIITLNGIDKIKTVFDTTLKLMINYIKEK